MSENTFFIERPVGAGGKNDSVDTFKVQALLNAARVRINMAPIGLDGDVGPETIGAISDFQRQCFGKADGRVDPGYKTLNRLIEIYVEPKLSSPTTFMSGKNNRYKVTVGADGRIIVQRDDWISKYSAAIYKDYIHIEDFGRYENGQMGRLSDPNLIRTGEVIYHIPTFEKFMGDKMGPIPTLRNMSDERKKQITRDAVKQDFDLKGDYGLKIADRIGDLFQYGSPVVDVISWAAPAVEALAERVALVAVVFETYGMHRDFLNVSDKDIRMYGMRAAAYSTTAWAFNKPMPSSSPTIRGFHKAQPKSPQQMNRLDQFWMQSAKAAKAAQERFADEKFGGPSVAREKKLEAWKIALRTRADDSPAKLSKALMAELGELSLEKTIPATKKIWESQLSVLYPD